MNFDRIKITESNLKMELLFDNAPKIISKQIEIKELCLRAQGEVAIREAITELRVWSETHEFNTSDHVTNSGDKIVLIKDWKDLMTYISDNLALLASLKESKYFGPFADSITQFEFKISFLDENLHKLNQAQRKWIYLEPIFSRKALPQEEARFKRIDGEQKSIMSAIEMNKKVCNIVNIPGLKNNLETITDQLDRCQKALNDYLEDKRNKFARF